MKNVFLVLLIIFASCRSVFYQVYKAEPVNGKIDSLTIKFEDFNCVISYNLWGEGGNAGFNIYNKTSKDLIILTDKSFFVINGIVNDYFKNRTFVHSIHAGSSVSYSSCPYWQNTNTRITNNTSSSSSISYTEAPRIIIPPNTSKNISEFIVSKSRINSCDLIKYPRKRETIKTIKYDKSSSPLVFYNIITYIFNSDTNRIENKFFITGLTNMIKSDVFEDLYIKECDWVTEKKAKVAKFNSPQLFYVKYLKSQ